MVGEVISSSLAVPRAARPRYRPDRAASRDMHKRAGKSAERLRGVVQTRHARLRAHSEHALWAGGNRPGCGGYAVEITIENRVHVFMRNRPRRSLNRSISFFFLFFLSPILFAYSVAVSIPSLFLFRHYFYSSSLRVVRLSFVVRSVTAIRSSHVDRRHRDGHCQPLTPLHPLRMPPPPPPLRSANPPPRRNSNSSPTPPSSPPPTSPRSSPSSPLSSPPAAHRPPPLAQSPNPPPPPSHTPPSPLHPVPTLPSASSPSPP